MLVEYTQTTLNSADFNKSHKKVIRHAAVSEEESARSTRSSVRDRA